MPDIGIGSGSSALDVVPRRWRAEVVRFLEDGEASDGFLAFLESNPSSRAACESALRSDVETAILVAALGRPDDEPVRPDDHLVSQGTR